MAHMVGSGPKAADAIAKGVTFETSLSDTASVILDDDLAPKGYSYLLVNKGRATLASCMFSGNADPHAFLSRLYRPTLSKSLLYPLASLYFKSRLIDESCNHKNCECTWCRCRRERSIPCD